MPRDVGDRKCPNRGVPIETQATESPMHFLLLSLGFPFAFLRLSFDVFVAVPGLSFGLPLGFQMASWVHDGRLRALLKTNLCLSCSP